MNLNYPVGDFLIRVKNAARASRKQAEAPMSKIVLAAAEVLKKEGYLSKVEKKDDKVIVTLAYQSKEPVLMDLKLKSKPGLRIYTDVDELSKQRGAGIFILSTSKGVISSIQALKDRIGGEVLAEIW